MTTAIKNNDLSVAANIEYSPYGEILNKPSSGNPWYFCPFRFSTKYCDTETGLYYFGYRFYNPETARWLNRDPIGEKGGKNLYGYLRNKPLSSHDYLGLKQCKNTGESRLLVTDFETDLPGQEIWSIINSLVPFLDITDKFHQLKVDCQCKQLCCGVKWYHPFTYSVWEEWNNAGEMGKIFASWKDKKDLLLASSQPFLDKLLELVNIGDIPGLSDLIKERLDDLLTEGTVENEREFEKNKQKQLDKWADECKNKCK